MPGVQRDAGAWDKFDEGTDSDTDSSDSRVVRVNMGDASDDEATPDEYRWLGDEHEDLGQVASVPARLDRIGWNDDAFRAAALQGEGEVKFHEVLGRTAESLRSLDPYDATCRSFWVRVDGVGFTKWSDEYCVAKPYDGDVHGAFVSAAAATMRHFRQKGLGVVAAYTQSDEVTFLCAGPAVLYRGASDGTRRLLTLFTSVFSKRFEQAEKEKVQRFEEETRERLERENAETLGAALRGHEPLVNHPKRLIDELVDEFAGKFSANDRRNLQLFHIKFGNVQQNSINLCHARISVNL